MAPTSGDVRRRWQGCQRLRGIQVGDVLLRVGVRAIPFGIAVVAAGFILKSLGTQAGAAHAGLSDPGISVFGTIHPEIFRLRTPLGAGLPAGSVRVASLDPQIGSDVAASGRLTEAGTSGCGNASYEYDGPASFDKRFSPDDACPASFESQFKSAVQKLASGLRSLSGRDLASAARLTEKPAGTPSARTASSNRIRPGQTSKTSAALPEDDGRTAIYDITARMVYLPGGRKLEAHSGLGALMDNPRHIQVRMHGATPPNVYNLTLRERPFHGIRAIRLNPVDRDAMHGRAGILAHPYMLGANGQSNGCVSLKDYQAFLDHFDDGKITRLVVVERLDSPPGKLAAGTLPAMIKNKLAAVSERSRQYAAAR
jgi:hypothetical protein